MRETAPPATPFGLVAWALKPSPAALAVLVITLLVVWFCEFAIPFLLGATVDAAVSGVGAFPEIFCLGAAALLIALVLYLAHRLYLREETRLVAHGTFRLRHHLYARLLDQPLPSVTGSRSGEIAQRLMSDTEVLDAHAIYLFADVPFSVLTVLGVFAVMSWMEPVLALLVSAVLVLVATLSQYVGRPLGTAERLIRHRWARLGGRLQETLDCIRVVKSFGRERFEILRLDREGERLRRAETTAGEITSRLEPILQLMTTFGFLAVVWYGAVLVHTGALTPGRLVAFIAYMELMREPIRDAGAHYAHYKQSAGTLRRIAELLARFSVSVQSGTAAPEGPLTVELKDIRLSYPGGGPVLDGVSVSASPGEVIAVVGENGAGKSTLINILLGLLKPDSGTIRVGGIPLEEWDAGAFRHAAAVLPQGTLLFHATIRENILYGLPEAGSGDDTSAAIEMAGLAPVIARLPHGINTVVGDRGEKLSGGERQRVALARALVRKPRILVLDEPASALDAVAFASLLRTIRERAGHRLTFVASHQPEIVALADRVIVLERGAPARTCRPSELGVINRAAA